MKLNDLICALKLAKETVGGDTEVKFVIDDDYDETLRADDVLIKGLRSLVKEDSTKSHSGVFVSITYF
jgi:hypothetical protein